MKTKGLVFAALIGIFSTAAQADSNPQPTSNRCSMPEPEYPPVARRYWTQGTVRVAIAIGADGRVERASVRQSSGSELLDNAALAAARQAQCATGAAETLLRDVIFEMPRTYWGHKLKG